MEAASISERTKPSMGKSPAARVGDMDPTVQRSGDERRERYNKPARLFPAFRFERGINPRPHIDTSGTNLSTPAGFASGTAWAQPDFHTDARGASWAAPEGGAPKRRQKFSAKAQAIFLNTQPLPDAPDMASVQRVGDERSHPARGSIESSENVHQMYQRRVSNWRRAQYQPAQTRLKGL